jgi:hypothetical protein
MIPVLSQIHGSTQFTSFAKSVFEEKEHKKFGRLDRNIIPCIFEQETYSVESREIGEKKASIEIYDNIDRFFKRDLKWICEQNDEIGSNAIDTGKLLTTESNFDLDKFKQAYFTKMDFISHFASANSERASERKT